MGVLSIQSIFVCNVQNMHFIGKLLQQTVTPLHTKPKKYLVVLDIPSSSGFLVKG